MNDSARVPSRSTGRGWNRDPFIAVKDFMATTSITYADAQIFFAQIYPRRAASPYPSPIALAGTGLQPGFGRATVASRVTPGPKPGRTRFRDRAGPRPAGDWCPKPFRGLIACPDLATGAGLQGGFPAREPPAVGGSRESPPAGRVKPCLEMKVGSPATRPASRFSQWPDGRRNRAWRRFRISGPPPHRQILAEMGTGAGIFRQPNTRESGRMIPASRGCAGVPHRSGNFRISTPARSRPARTSPKATP